MEGWRGGSSRPEGEREGTRVRGSERESRRECGRGGEGAKKDKKDGMAIEGEAML